MSDISVAKNSFSGSCDLRALPEQLKRLFVNVNDLSGSLDLTCLPKTLSTLDLSQNEFGGKISLDTLPERLFRLSIYKNNLTGRFQILSPPPALIWLDARANCFHWRAFVSGGYSKMSLFLRMQSTRWSTRVGGDTDVLRRFWVRIGHEY